MVVEAATNVWTLAYSGTSYTFGAQYPVFHVAAPDFGSPDLRSDDADLPRRDGRAFGHDYRGGRTVSLELGVVGADEAETRELLATLSSAWRADAIRSTPGEVASLTMTQGGRSRIVYGRPRRFSIVEDDITQGAASVVCDFETVDDVYYDATQRTDVLPVSASASGGISGALSGNLSTLALSSRDGFIDNLGNVETWPVITITGPVARPVVELVGEWALTFDLTIASGQTLTVDTRPWKRSALLGSGSVAGKLTRSSARISAAKVPTGRRAIRFRGVSSNGASIMTFRTRDAYSSL
jgi:hypothetical protein